MIAVNRERRDVYARWTMVFLVWVRHDNEPGGYAG